MKLSEAIQVVAFPLKCAEIFCPLSVLRIRSYYTEIVRGSSHTRIIAKSPKKHKIFLNTHPFQQKEEGRQRDSIVKA